MADLPLTKNEVVDAFSGDDLSTTEALKIQGSRWDGKGKPPSRNAAVGWLLIHGGPGMTVERARRIVGESGTLTAVGDRVRKRKSMDEIRADERRKHQSDRKKTAEREQAEAIADQLGLDEQQADELSDLLGGDIGGPSETDPRGAPLWRYEGSEENLAGLTVKDRSRSAVDMRDPDGKLIRSGIDQGERDSRRGRPWVETAQGVRTSARYFEQDTLEPLKWSAEQRADLQRVLSNIGLYGKNAKVRLGSWTAKDQAVYAEVLASANEEGLTWLELLNKWKRNPPQDILDEINGGSGTRERPPLVIQHANPVDVQETAREVSRDLIGRVDRGFVNRTPGGYNQLETQAQTAAYNAAEEGGTVTDAPSVGAFASDQLRRARPAEVDSYSTLGAFNEVLRQLGLAG